MVCPYTIYTDGANLPSTFKLNARFLHNQMSDSKTINRTLFTGLLATERYKVHLYIMDIYGVHLCYETSIYADAFRLDTRFLHSQTSNSYSVHSALFTRFLAIERYKVCLYTMYI